MSKENAFEQTERGYGGKLKYILCPHLAERGESDERTRYISLDDAPEHTAILALCGVCVNVVRGTMAAEIVQMALQSRVDQIAADAFRKAWRA